MELAVHGSKSKVKVSKTAFDRPFSEALVHQVVTAFLAGARSGTKAQKNRSAVRGGGAKPFRQKGTGRARAGTIRSPLWRSGGVTFAAQPRDHSQKVNRKMYRGAMQAILSELVRQERLLVVEELKLEAPRTRDLAAMLKEMDCERALIVTDELDGNLFLAARNIPHVDVIDVKALDPVSLVAAQKVLLTVDAVKQIEESLA